MWLLSRIGYPVQWLPPFADKLLLMTTERWSISNKSCMFLCLMALRGDSMLYYSVELQWANSCDVSSVRFFCISSAEPAPLLQCNWRAEDKEPARTAQTCDRSSACLAARSFMIVPTLLPNACSIQEKWRLTVSIPEQGLLSAGTLVMTLINICQAAPCPRVFDHDTCCTDNTMVDNSWSTAARRRPNSLGFLLGSEIIEGFYPSSLLFGSQCEARRSSVISLKEQKGSSNISTSGIWYPGQTEPCCCVNWNYSVKVGLAHGKGVDSGKALPSDILG